MAENPGSGRTKVCLWLPLGRNNVGHLVWNNMPSLQRGRVPWRHVSRTESLPVCAILISALAWATLAAAEPRAITAHDVGFSPDEIEGSVTFTLEAPSIYAVSFKVTRVYGQHPMAFDWGPSVAPMGNFLNCALRLFAKEMNKEIVAHARPSAQSNTPPGILIALLSKGESVSALEDTRFGLSSQVLIPLAAEREAESAAMCAKALARKSSPPPAG